MVKKKNEGNVNRKNSRKWREEKQKGRKNKRTDDILNLSNTVKGILIRYKCNE